MNSVRSRLAALAVAAVIFGGPGASLATQDRHPVCVATQHDCGKPAKISSCCCGDAAAPHDAGAPAQPRVDISTSISWTAAVPIFAAPLLSQPRVDAIQASPPRSCLVDLPTLFASLLI